MSGFCHHAIIYFVKIHTLSDPRRGAPLGLTRR
jgi:hypothetical protein